MGRAGPRLAVVGVVLALVPWAAAFACVSNGNLALSAGRATAGQIVTVTGHSFNPEPTFSALQARFNSPTGPVLWEGRPTSAGDISFQFTVPDVGPGYYVLLIYQHDAAGALAPGMPARAAIEVTAPGAQDRPAPQARPLPTTSSGGGAPLGLLPLALMAAGVAIVGGVAVAAARAAGPRRSREAARLDG